MVDSEWILCFYHHLFPLSILGWIYSTIFTLLARTLYLSTHRNADGWIWVVDGEDICLTVLIMTTFFKIIAILIIVAVAVGVSCGGTMLVGGTIE